MTIIRQPSPWNCDSNKLMRKFNTNSLADFTTYCVIGKPSDISFISGVKENRFSLIPLFHGNKIALQIGSIVVEVEVIQLRIVKGREFSHFRPEKNSSHLQSKLFLIKVSFTLSRRNLKNGFHPEFPSTQRLGIWKPNNNGSFWISWVQLWQGNHISFVMPSFSKSSAVFKIFPSTHTKTQSWRFQMPPVWKAFSKSSVFVTG